MTDLSPVSAWSSGSIEQLNIPDIARPSYSHTLARMSSDAAIDSLADLLQRVPAISMHIGRGWAEDGNWWVKFQIEIGHPLAWRVVQELAHVLNYVSINERLPTVFMPLSPPPYMNGGPDEFLSWVIESKVPAFGPDLCAQWLEGRLPRPVDNLSAWGLDAE